jgi:hypothetical protein
MLTAVALTAALTLGAADAKPEAWVVVTKRSGIAKPATTEFAKTISETLTSKGVPNTTEPADLTSCGGRLMCLLEAAQKKKVSVLVTVEAASVLEDVVIHSDAISIDEDGKKIGAFDYEGPGRAFSADLAKRIDDSFVPAVRSTLGIAAAPIAKAEVVKPESSVPPPTEATPPPVVAKTEAPAVVVEKPAPSSGMSGQKIGGIVVAAAGAVGLLVGAGMGGKALGSAGTRSNLCPEGKPCTNPAAFTAYEDSRSAQTIATACTITGAVLVAAGAVLFFVDFGGGASVAAAPAVSGDGAGVVLHGSF